MDKLMRISGVFALISAVAMALVWALIVGCGFLAQEMRAHPVQYAFLLTAEGITACLLFISGVGLLRNAGRALRLFYIAMGMMLYAVIFAAGKFLDLGLTYFTGLFALVALATAVLLGIHVMRR
jgi:hypothetical protein